MQGTIAQLTQYESPLCSSDSTISLTEKKTRRFKMKYSFDVMDYTIVQIHNKMSSIPVPQMLKIFRTDVFIIYKDYSLRNCLCTLCH